MASLVFFGLDGVYSSTVLQALCDAGKRPALVVHGRERSSRREAPFSTRWPASPSPLDRFIDTVTSLAVPRDAPEGHDLVKLAHGLGIDVLSTNDCGSDRSLATLRATAPDAYVIAGFSHLLSPAALALAKKGGLNLHAGKLPEERGASPLFWALKAGRTTASYTLHRLDAGEDTGEIVMSETLEHTPGTNGSEILARLARAAAPRLVAALDALLEDRLESRPQDGSLAQRMRRPTLADRRIDTGRPAVEVYTFVAGCSPQYALYAEVAADRFFVAGAVSYDAEAKLEYDFVLLGDRLLLQCWPGMVELKLKEDGVIFSAEYAEDDG